jgi:hypothetical protein
MLMLMEIFVTIFWATHLSATVDKVNCFLGLFMFSKVKFPGLREEVLV